MPRALLIGVASIVAAAAAFTGAAVASGPAAPGKQIINLTCDQLGPVTVSVAPSMHDNNGAGQIVGQAGHGIPVAFTTTTTDATKHVILDVSSSAVGGGNAHPNQPTVHCSGTVFSAPASVFFGGGPLPPGVSSTDIIEVSISGQVIPKV
jgi:hypothetical protein